MDRIEALEARLSELERWRADVTGRDTEDAVIRMRQQLAASPFTAVGPVRALATLPQTA